MVIDTRCSKENFEEPLRWPMAAQSGTATGPASGSREIVHDGTSDPSIGSTVARRLMACTAGNQSLVTTRSQQFRSSSLRRRSGASGTVEEVEVQGIGLALQ